MEGFLLAGDINRMETSPLQGERELCYQSVGLSSVVLVGLIGVVD
jgi:hypothetical protein